MPSGIRKVADYTEEDLNYRIDALKDQLRIKNERIAVLESELKNHQDIEQEKIQEEINKYQPWMCEAIRMRRVAEAIGEDLERYKRRAEKAERGLRNLRKWLEIQGWGVGPDG